MTTCTKAVTRIVNSRLLLGKEGKLIITIYPDGLIGLRQPRQRKEIKVEAGSLFLSGIKTQINAEKREKKLARKLSKFLR